MNDAIATLPPFAQYNLIRAAARDEIKLVQAVWPNLSSLPPAWVSSAFTRALRKQRETVTFTVNETYLRAAFDLEIALSVAEIWLNNSQLEAQRD